MATVDSERTFAAAPSGSSAPDSITAGDGSVWVEYGNGANSSGQGGSSTIVQYDPNGAVKNSYTVAGSADGLKYDPATGNVWILQNQDANSTLSFINPATNQLSSPLSYGPPYDPTGRGFDDVAFDGKKIFLSETNPSVPGDSVIVQLQNGNAPFGTLQTTNVLSLADTGTNLATGDTNQPLPVNDPDSLKTLPDGSLILASEKDAAFTIVQNPGTPSRAPASSNSPLAALLPMTRSFPRPRRARSLSATRGTQPARPARPPTRCARSMSAISIPATSMPPWALRSSSSTRAPGM